MFIKRELAHQLHYLLKHSPVVTLVGPRQVGKTTLAKTFLTQHACFYDLEKPADFFKFEDPYTLLKTHENQLVIIDEAQQKPELFPIIRVLIDEKKIPGRFLLLGSATPNLKRQGAESLAGRNAILELSPLSIDEVKPHGISLKSLWLNGGFPEALLSQDAAWRYDWRQHYISNLAERDIYKLIGFQTQSTLLLRLLNMLSSLQAQQLNASHLARSLAVSAPTVLRYIDILEEIFFIRRLNPLTKNIRKRYIKTPKIYLRDSGLLHNLLSIHNESQLWSHPILGFSWEGFVIEQIAAALGHTHELGFWRTASGAEIDLVILKNNQPFIGIEIKAHSAPKLEKGFFIACQDLSIPHKWVIYPEKESYIHKNQVQIFSLPDALAQIRKLLSI